MRHVLRRIYCGGETGARIQFGFRVLIVGAALVAYGACTTTENIVTRELNKRGEPVALRLTTTNYISADADRILELDKGERTLTIKFHRDLKTNVNSMQITVKLYRDDASLASDVRLIVDSAQFRFASNAFVATNSSEDVTVLDSGGRRDYNPALAPDAQAQTGYISFGKPTAAGLAKRHWTTYTMQRSVDPELATALSSAKIVSINIVFGDMRGEAILNDKQLTAWKNFLIGASARDIGVKDS